MAEQDQTQGQIPAFTDEHIDIVEEALPRPQLPEVPNREHNLPAHPLPHPSLPEVPNREHNLPAHPLPHPSLPEVPNREHNLPAHPLPHPSLPEVPNRQPLRLGIDPLPRPVLPEVADRELLAFEYPFTGAWIADEDPLKIGIQNFADLQNFRYTNNGVEGVQGYTKITTNALGKPRMRSGIQFIKVINGVAQSFVLVQAWADLAHTSSAVYQHTAVIPAAGDFAATALFTDNAGAGFGRFALGHDGTVLYCNGVDTTIWGSTEARVGAVINYDDVLQPLGLYYDYTARLNSILTDPPHEATLAANGGGDVWILVGSTRPIQGIKWYIVTPSAGAGVSVEYWDGGAWVAVGGLVDGTAGMTVTGTMSFTSTVTTAHIRFEADRLLYFYRVKLTGAGGGTIISQVTVDKPFQPVVDIWDGVDRKPVLFLATTTTVVNLQGPWSGTRNYALNDSVTSGGVTYVSLQFNNFNNAPATSPTMWKPYSAQTTKDFTLEVQNPSQTEAPVAAVISGPNLEMIVGFETRMTALRFRMIADQVNYLPSLLIISYWGGDAWHTATIQSDTTKNDAGDTSLFHSGVLSWGAPASFSELKKTIDGVEGYFYKLNTSADFGNPVLLDVISGIPAQRWNVSDPVSRYRFPFHFAGRTMLAGDLGTNELNKIDYTGPLEADVWNGTGSSDLGKEIFIGEEQALTAVIEMSNRYAGILTAIAVALKASQTWILQGNAPDNFQTFLVNDEVGCPAPLSVTLADVPSTAEQQALRNIAMWCSGKGPMMFDGTVLLAMRFPQPDGTISSIDKYFKPLAQEPGAINPASFESVQGWYDPNWSEYNLLLPCGAGQVTCNTWLVADMRRRKWFRKVPVAYPQMVVPVHDTRGVIYTYGGVETGHLLTLETGTTWDGSNIIHSLTTADTPQGQSAWMITQTRFVKLLAMTETGAMVDLVGSWAADSTGAGVGFAEQIRLPLVPAFSVARWVRKTNSVNITALTHQWQFSCTTSDKQRAPRLLGFGTLYRVIREDLF